jgi:hypothetical protein
MKTTGCLAVIAAAVMMGLSGGAAKGNQDTIPQIPTARSTAAKSVTVTGCVGRGTTPDSYVLTNVTQEGHATVNDARKPETLLLSAEDIDISKHVGHLVSVTGMHAATNRAPTGATDVTPATESTMTKAAAKLPIGFAVTSLKMISGTCPEAGD